MRHQIYPLKKSKISRTQKHILWCWVPPKKKSAEILGTTIESAEVHYTKPEDEFRRGIGLNTKFRPKKISRSQVRNLCSGVPLKTIFFFLQPIRGHRISIFRRYFFQQILCPIVGRKKKSAKSSEVCLAKKNLRLQCRVLNPRPYPTYGPWMAHVIGRNLPGWPLVKWWTRWWAI